MAEPITLTAAAIAVAHFVGEHGLAHTIGAEIHHFYREFLERWREALGDTAFCPPRNHDFQKAGHETVAFKPVTKGLCVRKTAG